MDQIGPMKYFRTKALMWDFLATKINSFFNTLKTSKQVSKRYDTVIRQKKEDVNKNRVSGAVRGDVEFQDEIDKIAAADDSIEPEVLRGINFVKYKDSRTEILKPNKQPNKPRWDKPNKKYILNSITDAMHNIEHRRTEREERKEERRIERHQEYLEVIRSFKKD